MLQKGSTLTMLVIGRVLQGFSAAAVASVGFAMLYDAFGSESAGGALGWVSAALDAGGFIGPAIGGVLFSASGESAVFYFAYAFIAVDAALGIAVIVSRKPQDDKTGETNEGTTTVLPGKKCPRYVSLIRSSSESVPHINSVASISSDTDVDSIQEAKSGKASTTVPSKSSASILRILRIPRLIVAVSGWLVVGIFETAFDSVLPMFVQDTFNWTTLGAGLIFIPFYMPAIVLSPVTGYVIDRIRNASRILAALGFFMCGPSFILLGLVDNDTIGKEVLLCVLLTLIGIGTAFSGPPLLKEVGVVVEIAEKADPGAFGPSGATAQAYGVHNAAFALGNLLGPVLAGALNAVYGWAVMGWFFGLLSLLTGVVVLCFLEGWIGNMSGGLSTIPKLAEKETIDLSEKKLEMKEQFWFRFSFEEEHEKYTEKSI